MISGDAMLLTLFTLTVQLLSVYFLEGRSSFELNFIV